MLEIQPSLDKDWDEEVCEWKGNNDNWDWITECLKSYTDNTCEDSITTSFTFCPYCGKKIKEIIDVS